MVNFGVILDESSVCGCRARPKNFFGVKKLFSGPETIFMVLSSFWECTAPKNFKKIDFGAKSVNFGVILGEIPACACAARSKKILTPKQFSWC